MPTLEAVRPGDVITSELWNDLQQMLEDHEERIAALEGGAGNGTTQPPLEGAFDVEFLSVNPATILAGGPATFRYRLRSRATRGAEVTLAPTVVAGANPGEWPGRLQILDENQVPNPGRTVQLAAGTERIFHLRITAVPAVPNGTELSLVVTARAGGIIGSSGARTFTVGEATAPQDETIELLPPAPGDVQFLGNGSFDGTTLTLDSGAQALLPFLARFTVAGSYDVFDPEVTGDGWSAVRHQQSTPATFEIPAVTGTAEVRPVSYVVTAGDGVAASGRVVLALQRSGAPIARTVEINLNRG